MRQIVSVPSPLDVGSGHGQAFGPDHGPRRADPHAPFILWWLSAARGDRDDDGRPNA